MIDLSLCSLVDILTGYGHRFIIEPSVIEGHKIFSFVVDKSYPTQGHHSTSGDTRELKSALCEHRREHPAKIQLHYDCTTQTIVSISADWYEIIKEHIKKERKRARESVVLTTSNV